MAAMRQTSPAYWNMPAYGRVDHVAKGSMLVRMFKKTKDSKNRRKPRITMIKANMRFGRILLVSEAFYELLEFLRVLFRQFSSRYSARGQRLENICEKGVEDSFNLGR